MCGIFGLSVSESSPLNEKIISTIFRKLFFNSSSRGGEASGCCISYDEMYVFKDAIAPKQFLKENKFKQLLSEVLDKFKQRSCKSVLNIFGHARLVTNGSQIDTKNNQPVIEAGLVGVHNGIIVNVDQLSRNMPNINPSSSELDSSFLFSILGERIESGEDIVGALRFLYSSIYGAANIAYCSKSGDEMILSTNTGSLYYYYDPQSAFFAFASEYFILKNSISSLSSFKEIEIKQLKPGMALRVDVSSSSFNEFSIDKSESLSPSMAISQVYERNKEIIDLSARYERDRMSLQRCSRCILPETFPYIKFDSDGVCSVCSSYSKLSYYGENELHRLADLHRGKHPIADCVVAFSGGRDSSYGLHYLKEVLGLRPLAYTYDWGMVTDLARRNQSRLTAKLGVEHIIISADIRKKRNNIRKNIHAWLKKPNLGMIPLLMAGDKEYMAFPGRLMRKYDINLSFFFGNRLERTGFKTGFCGVPDVNSWYTDYKISKKMRLIQHYASQFLLNPAYLNSSIFDSLVGLRSSFFRDRSFKQLFEFIPWSESHINSTLKNEFDWEFAGDTDSSWRIGDGTAAFYNYIYYTVAGFTENDTLRSNQIREGLINREKALDLVLSENQPRFSSIQEYAQVINFDLHAAISIINKIPKLYVR